MMGVALAACIWAEMVKRVPEIPIVTFEGKGLHIAEWLVAGPFFGGGEEDLWENDLILAGEKGRFTGRRADFETAVRSMPGIAERRNGDSPGFLAVKKSRFLDFHYLFHLPFAEKGKPGQAFAACVIRSPRAVDAVLLMGSSDAHQVWLNGEKATTYPARHGVNTFQEALPVTLRTGDNFLLVKVVKWENPGWGLTVRIAENVEAAAGEALQAADLINFPLLKRVVLQGGQVLPFEPRGVPAEAVFEARILSRDGTTRLAGKVGGQNRWRLPVGLQPDLYQFAILSRGSWHTQDFAVGEVNKLADQALAGAREAQSNDARLLDIAALERRLVVLRRPENRNNTKAQREIEAKLVFVLKELLAIGAKPDAGQSVRRGQPGLHLHGFRSVIDGSLQFYRVYFPEGETEIGWPVAVVLPPAVATPRPFIESVFISEHNEAEHLAGLARRHGFALVWPGYRNVPSGAPCETTHFNEVLASVAKDYHIDNRRVHLLGACTGAAQILELSRQWPERFAGVGLVNPVFAVDRAVTPWEDAAFSGSPLYERWLNPPDLVGSSLERGLPPTVIVCDGAEPGWGHLESSMAFLHQARSRGIAVNFIQTGQTLGKHFGAWETLLEHLRGIRGTGARAQSEYLEPAGPNRGVAAAFIGRFLLVRGTGGDEKARRAITELCSAFQQSWRQTHFVDCAVVDDVQLTPADEVEASLVLVGGPDSNSVWARRYPTFRSTREAVTLNGKSWVGEGLTFQALAPAFGTIRRPVVLIGTNAASQPAVGSMNLSCVGWFDYAIWQKGSQNGKLLAAGVWDEFHGP